MSHFIGRGRKRTYTRNCTKNFNTIYIFFFLSFFFYFLLRGDVHFSQNNSFLDSVDVRLAECPAPRHMLPYVSLGFCAQLLLSECEHLYLATWDGQVRRIPSQAPYKLVGGARKGCCPNARGSHQDVRAAAHSSWPSPKDSANSNGRRPGCCCGILISGWLAAGWPAEFNQITVSQSDQQKSMRAEFSCT